MSKSKCQMVVALRATVDWPQTHTDIHRQMFVRVCVGLWQNE
jgi:hypothetical protein